VALIALALMLTAPPIVQPPVVRPPMPILRVPPSSRMSFDIDAQRYGMPVPAGYCTARNLPSVYTEDEVNEAGVILSKLAFVFLCEMNDQGANDQDFIYVKYIKNYRPNVTDRTEFIRASAAKFAHPEYVRQRETREFVDDIARRAERDTGEKVDADISGVGLGHDDICIYTGSRIAIAATASGKETRILAVTCTTMINGRIVTADIASRADRGLDFDALISQLKQVVETIEPEHS
jgi:hypothetical protein